MERSRFATLAPVVLAVVASPFCLFAATPAVQEIRVLDYEVQDAGNFGVLVANNGSIGSRRGSNQPGSTEPSFEWPSGSMVDYLWVAGAWIGAFKNGEPHVTTTAFQVEVRPGPTAIDRLYVTQEGAPGGARHPSPDADDDDDGRFDEDRLNGYDDDFDGLVDEDFAGISDQMFFCEYNDTDPTIPPPNPEHVPLEIRVEQTTLAWSDPRIQNVLGVRYTIENQGISPLDNVYLGLFADCDIGPRDIGNASEDDRGGFWEGDVTAELGGDVRTVRVSLGYMYDADGDANQSPGYIGFVFLGARHPSGPPVPQTLANFRVFSGRASFAVGGDPSNDAERYQVLNGTSPQSLPDPDPISGIRPPVTVSRNDDYRIAVSAGPIETVEPGDQVEVSYALVIGAGLDGLIANAARAILLYANDWRPEGPLPVSVQDFTAVADENGVRLDWRLVDAEEASAVRVQRAASENGPWEDREVLVPAPSMHFEDRDVMQAAWYRLVLESADGTQQPQRAIAVRYEPSVHERVALAPPIERSDGIIELRYTLAYAGNHDLGVYDVHGRRVADIASGHAAAGSHVRFWSPSASRVGLVRGVYFVRLASSGVSASRKLLVLGRKGARAQ